MSGQSWIRRNSPSSSTKHGPMKATLPMSSLTRQNSNLRQSQDSSPLTLSPTSPWKTRASPDHILFGIRSPGALNYKGKCHLSSGHDSRNIRRAASLDTIYLTGQWPRDLHTSLLQLDKATQTDELECKKNLRYTPDFSVMTEDKLDKMIRHRLLQRSATCKETIRPPMQEHSSQTSTPPPSMFYSSSTPPPMMTSLSTPPPSPSSQHHVLYSSMSTASQPSGAAIPAVRGGPVRCGVQMRHNSTEGLNQEIERLVLRAMSSLGGAEGEEEKVIQITPEGHRAPLADLLRLNAATTRSVNTQTPGNGNVHTPSGVSTQRERTGSATNSSNSSTSSHGSPMHVTQFVDHPRLGGGGGEEEEEEEEGGERVGGGGGGGVGGGGTWPKINRFTAREPPDGCERVSLRLFNEESSSKDLSLIDYCDLKPTVTFQLRPSLGSAFLPLSSQTQPESASGTDT